MAEESACATLPRDVGELVDGCDHEGRQATVNLIVDHDDRKAVGTREFAIQVVAPNIQTLWPGEVRMYLETILVEALTAPGAVLHGGRSWPITPAIFLQPSDRCARALVLCVAQRVGGRATPHPEPDFDWPSAEVAICLPFQFERTDEACGTLQLVESQKAQCIAHDDGGRSRKRRGRHTLRSCRRR